MLRTEDDAMLADALASGWYAGHLADDGAGNCEEDAEVGSSSAERVVGRLRHRIGVALIGTSAGRGRRITAGPT